MWFFTTVEEVLSSDDSEDIQLQIEKVNSYITDKTSNDKPNDILSVPSTSFAEERQQDNPAVPTVLNTVQRLEAVVRPTEGIDQRDGITEIEPNTIETPFSNIHINVNYMVDELQRIRKEKAIEHQLFKKGINQTLTKTNKLPKRSNANVKDRVNKKQKLQDSHSDLEIISDGDIASTFPNTSTHDSFGNVKPRKIRKYLFDSNNRLVSVDKKKYVYNPQWTIAAVQHFDIIASYIPPKFVEKYWKSGLVYRALGQQMNNKTSLGFEDVIYLLTSCHEQFAFQKLSDLFVELTRFLHSPSQKTCQKDLKTIDELHNKLLSVRGSYAQTLRYQQFKVIDEKRKIENSNKKILCEKCRLPTGLFNTPISIQEVQPETSNLEDELPVPVNVNGRGPYRSGSFGHYSIREPRNCSENDLTDPNIYVVHDIVGIRINLQRSTGYMDPKFDWLIIYDKFDRPWWTEEEGCSGALDAYAKKNWRESRFQLLTLFAINSYQVPFSSLEQCFYERLYQHHARYDPEGINVDEVMPFLPKPEISGKLKTTTTTRTLKKN